jgi:hypothetical protein
MEEGDIVPLKGAVSVEKCRTGSHLRVPVFHATFSLPLTVHHQLPYRHVPRQKMWKKWLRKGKLSGVGGANKPHRMLF